MSFTVGALPYSGWEQAISLLNSLDWAQGALSDIENWLHLDDGVGHVVVLHRRPEYLIAAAIAQGKTPAEACQEWQQQAEGLLKWLRHNRRRACLIEIDALLAESANLEPLRERLGLKLPEHPLAHIHAQLPQVQPLYLLCALQTVRQSEACQSLMAELEASTLPLNDRSFVMPSLDIDALAEKLNADSAAAEQKKQNTQHQLEQAQRDIEKLDQQLKTGQEEGGLLLEQLHLVQEEFEAKALSQKDLEHQLATSKQQQQKEQQNNHDLSAELKQARAQAEKAESTGKRERQTNQALSEELTQAKEQVENAAKTDKKKQEELQRTQEENSLLLEQLHLVQEELEKRFIAEQKLKQQLTEYSHDQDCALAAANQQIKNLQDELNNFKSSASWKVTAPVRAMGRPFKRLPLDKRKLKKQVKKLAKTPYFDSAWYLQTYPDVAEKLMNPAEHYLKFGADEGRNPSERFDTDWYLRANQDVQEFGMNPLIHFLEHGQAEGRAANSREQNSLPSPPEAN